MNIEEINIAELATWDDDALMQQLSALDLEDSALVEAAGFSAAQLEDMINALLGPDFEPDSESNQSRLDELAPKIVECPHCKKEFDAREA